MFLLFGAILLGFLKIGGWGDSPLPATISIPEIIFLLTALHIIDLFNGITIRLDGILSVLAEEDEDEGFYHEPYEIEIEDEDNSGDI